MTTETPTPETTDPTDRQLPEPVVPAGRDPLDDLTVGELGTVGKMLGEDPYRAIQGGQKWPALAHLAWVWAKRKDPTAKLAPYMAMTPDQVGAACGLTPPPEPAGDDVDEPDVELVDELADNPTEPTPA